MGSDSQGFDQWIEIDNNTIRSNITKLADIALQRGKDFVLMIKANAYGHGLLHMARLAQGQGARFLGVSDINDVILIRKEKVNTPILLFGEPRRELISQLSAHSVTQVVSSLRFLDDLCNKTKSLGITRVPIHVKVNTGLNRFGINPSEISELVKILSNNKHVKLEGMLTHYSSAESNLGLSNKQLQILMGCVQECRSAKFTIPYVHASNSAGTAWIDEQETNLVRLGAAAYGLQPSTLRNIDVQQGFAWKARLMSIVKVKKGEKAGYGGRWVAKRDSLIGAIGVGYYDGFRRTPLNPGLVLCHGNKTPVIGSVMMNHTLLDLTDIGEVVSIDDEVVLIGSQSEEKITFEQVGMQTDTINEEVLTSIRSTIPRLYLN